MIQGYTWYKDPFRVFIEYTETHLDTMCNFESLIL